MFERPILNGQCMDSTPHDVRLMRYRSHVLHSLLEGFVQRSAWFPKLSILRRKIAPTYINCSDFSFLLDRRGHDVLQHQLPIKMENVILVRLSPIQKALYTEFMNRFREAGNNGWLGLNPLKAFCVCCKVRLSNQKFLQMWRAGLHCTPLINKTVSHLHTRSGITQTCFLKLYRKRIRQTSRIWTSTTSPAVPKAKCQTPTIAKPTTFHRCSIPLRIEAIKSLLELVGHLQSIFAK